MIGPFLLGWDVRGERMFWLCCWDLESWVLGGCCVAACVLASGAFLGVDEIDRMSARCLVNYVRGFCIIRASALSHRFRDFARLRVRAL